MCKEFGGGAEEGGEEEKDCPAGDDGEVGGRHPGAQVEQGELQEEIGKGGNGDMRGPQ